MQRMRTDDDALSRESAGRLGATDSMKRECAAVRKALRKYLLGHVFTLQKIRIQRHLKTCAVCSSEHQALRMEMNTILLLKEVNPSEGLIRHWQAVAAVAAKLKTLLYRPLWMAAIAGALVLVYVNVMDRRGDPEIESLEMSLPPPSESAPVAASSSTATVFSLPPQPASAVPPAPAPPSARKAVHEAPAAEPLLVTLTPENEQAALRRINEVMRGHAALRKLHFSDAVKEVSGSLSPGELLTFFSRVASAGKVSYSRRRFDTFPADQLIPFVMKLMPASGTAALPAAPAEPKVYRPAERTVQPAPVSAQTTSP